MKNGAQTNGPQNDATLLVSAVLIGLGLFAWNLRFRFIALRYFYLDHSLQFKLCFLLLMGLIFLFGLARYRNTQIARLEKRAVTEEDPSSILLGIDTDTKLKVHLKEDFRTAHTQVIGSTNAGKTASAILPWSVQDIEHGRGMIIIDGKADQSFLQKLYSYAIQFNRQRDFKVFSLANPAISSSYNPLSEGTAEQITERFFSTLEITDPYYRTIQFSALRTILALLIRRGEKPMPGVVRELLRNKTALKSWLEGLQDPNLIADVQAMLENSEEEFQKKYSGLVTALGHFSQGGTAPLYNTRHPEINLSEVIQRKQICYFQLPTMQFPYLGEATGKLVLQTLQSVISEIQVGSKRPDSLFLVYLDDFNDYIYPAFASLLNKSRSANVGVVFSHQSLGDLEKVSPDFKQIIMTNTNIKIIMRSNDPESAEQFAKMIGTHASEKMTERRSRTLLGSINTGEQSVRSVEEYKIHPNVIKSELGRGEGIVVIPHPAGTEVKRVKFSTIPDLPVISLPIRDFSMPDLLKEATRSGVSTTSVKTLR